MISQTLASISSRLATLLSVWCLICALPSFAQSTAPPVARQDNVKEMIHGVEIVDPYRWLEEQDGAETRKWGSCGERLHALSARSAAAATGCRRGQGSAT